jgi:hypothetical protein
MKERKKLLRKSTEVFNQDAKREGLVCHVSRADSNWAHEGGVCKGCAVDWRFCR